MTGSNSFQAIELRVSALLLLIAVLVGCSKNNPTAALRQPLEVQCVDDAGGIPEGSWVCPASFTVECVSPGATDVDKIFSKPPEQKGCGDVELTVSPRGPFAVGTHDIQIRSRLADSDAAAEFLCESQLRVVDTTAPEVTAKLVELWPPNHGWRTISAQNCFEIKDRCDAVVDATLLWATSDEPANSTGDGNTEPDIKFVGCNAVQLRAERQGSSNGRVYRLGWRFRDDSGNATEATCDVAVPHDQGHSAAVTADAPMVTFENEPKCLAPDAGISPDAD